MDPLTHGLASYALKRTFFPSLPKTATPFVIAAGVVADLDWLSYLVGPASFYAWHRTYTHSLLGALLWAIIFGLMPFLIGAGIFLRTGIVGVPVIPAEAELPPKRRKFQIAKRIFLMFFTPCFCAGLLHIALDVLQSDPVSLFWPFHPLRVALDWLPNRDFWLAGILLLAILLPELFLLVGSEIGARNKRPRGRNGAIIGFAALALYIGIREVQHAKAYGVLHAATFSGDSPSRVAVLPDSVSLFTWHGIAETPSAIHIVDVPLSPGSYFSPSTALTIHKPGDSPILQAALASPAAVRFLKFARFPKATIQHETNGYSVEIRDLRYLAAQQSSAITEANINLDNAGRVTFDQLEWQKDSPRR